MFIDTHTHLNLKEFKFEVPAVLGRAKEAGVGAIINVGTDLKSSKEAIDLARRYPEVYAAVGVHPDASDDLDIEARGLLMDMAGSSKVVAIGEIGLDYYFLKRSSQYARYPKREVQIFCLEQMLDIALETNLPVILHCREAEADLVGILKGYANVLKGVVHCFSGNLDFADKILDMGFAVSFTGNITYKNNCAIEDIIRRLPLGSIMIETDCPFLPPEPYRGKRNEPAYVVEVAKKIAAIKGMTMAEIEAETTKKAKKLFRI